MIYSRRVAEHAEFENPGFILMSFNRTLRVSAVEMFSQIGILCELSVAAS